MMRAAPLAATGVLTLILVEILTFLAPVLATWLLAAVVVAFKIALFVVLIGVAIGVVGIGIFVFRTLRKRRQEAHY